MLQCSDESKKRDTRVRMVGTKSIVVASCVAALWLAPAALAEDYQLPPEVTPQIRSACETDVRRLCIGENPTVEKVKSCVAAKFTQLGRRCQVQLAMAGLKP
jgi:hypothetical protein